jgi:hypothetical protein
MLSVTSFIPHSGDLVFYVGFALLNIGSDDRCRMMLAALVTLVLSLGPAAEASPSKYPSNFPKYKPAPPNDGITTTYKSQSSSVKCKAIASTFNFQASQDAHASAGGQR